MPLPDPKAQEERDQFIARCMAKPTMRADFKDIKQRAAVCYSQWSDSKKPDKKSVNPR